MKFLKQFRIFLITTVMSLFPCMLAGCGNDSSYEKDGIRYEEEYIFENTMGMIKLTDLTYHDGVNETRINLSPIVASKNVIIKYKKPRIKIKATEDFSKNLGSKINEYFKQYELAKTVYMQNFQLNDWNILDAHYPEGYYNIELAIPGMKCVKKTIGYKDGQKVSETNESVGTYAPYKDVKKHEPAFCIVGYDSDKENIIYSAYPYDAVYFDRY